MKITVPGQETKLKVIAATHNPADTGAEAITGVGFQPKAVAIVAEENTHDVCVSVGFGDLTTNACIYIYDPAGTPSLRQNASNIVYQWESAGVYCAGAVTSFDSDGLTITWAKGGSPTGAVQMKILCIG